MPYINCPTCRRQVHAPPELVGLIYDCPLCGAEFTVREPGTPRCRASGTGRRRRPQSAFNAAVAWGLAFGLPALALALVLSQYAPVFGGVLELNLARPWSPARVALVPVHLFAFGLAGFVVGGVLGVLRAQSR